jgi:tagatose-1,6-bisphosphate aldolase
MESERSGVEVGLHGESIVVAAQAPAGGVLSGQQILSLRVESGGGLR